MFFPKDEDKDEDKDVKDIIISLTSLSLVSSSLGKNIAFLIFK